MNDDATLFEGFDEMWQVGQQNIHLILWASWR